MSEPATKEDLRQFGMVLLDKLATMLKNQAAEKNVILTPEWIKTKCVRKMLDISPGSVQNLRVEGKVRYKKVLGSYYYNRADLQKLFGDEKQEK